MRCVELLTYGLSVAFGLGLGFFGSRIGSRRLNRLLRVLGCALSDGRIEPSEVLALIEAVRAGEDVYGRRIRRIRARSRRGG